MTKTYSPIPFIKAIAFLLVLVMASTYVGGSYQISASTVKSSMAGKVDQTPNHSNVKGKGGVAPSGDQLDISPSFIRIPADIAQSKMKETAEAKEADGFVYTPDIPLSKELQEFTYRRSEEVGLDYSIVLGLMWRESTFNPKAIGYNSNGTRDRGIMQINDVNTSWISRELSLSNLMDPKENIIAGTEMLSRMVVKHGTYNGLMAYQMGEQGMLNKVRYGYTSDRLVNVVYTKSAEFQKLIDSSSKVESI